jgi:hypothetical protein
MLYSHQKTTSNMTKPPTSKEVCGILHSTDMISTFFKPRSLGINQTDPRLLLGGVRVLTGTKTSREPCAHPWKRCLRADKQEF